MTSVNLRFSSLVLIVCTLILSSACEPPGKPKLSEAEEEHPSDFKTLFGENCSGCHGADGQKGPGRVLNNALYLAVTSKDTVRQIVIHGRPGTLMPAWAQSQGGPLSDRDVEILVNGIYANWGKPFDNGSAALPNYSGAGFTGDPAKGKKLYARDCFACHATGGVAGSIIDPSYLALSSNQNLRTSIIVGRPDFPAIQMPNYRSLNAGHALSDQDIADLVSYLSSLRPPTSSIAMLEATNTAALETTGKGLK